MSYAVLDPPFNPTEELPIRFVVGVDLGQSKGYTAVIVNKITTMWNDQPRHNIVFLHRWRLQTSYPTIVRELSGLMDQLPRDFPEPPTLVADMTGVGRPIIDLMRESGLNPIGLTVTGGRDWSRPGASQMNVPKSLLASTMQILLQAQRIKIAEEMPLTSVLIRELENFKVKISATGNESFEAYRQSENDDLTLACAISCFVGEHPFSRPVVRLI